jgi:enoyl-CoA hydratase/carnithine racemase
MAAAPAYEHLLVDDPRAHVRRLTLDRPEKRNALNNALRGELFDALERADRDDAVRVTVIRGAGACFSAGYDLAGCGKSDLGADQTATDHDVCSSGAATSGGNVVIREGFIMAQSSFSAAC